MEQQGDSKSAAGTGTETKAAVNNADKKSKAEKALELALEIRKFEIELYWKRATYFWTFLAVALAGYLAVLGAKELPSEGKADALLVVSCLGVIFSLAWYFVNRGSKFWQENWEKHVDLLEDEINGPLYKVIVSKDKMRWWKPADPWPFSVSKINQILSLFVTLPFLLLAIKTLVHSYRFGWPPDWLPTSVLIVTSGCAVFLIWGGRTDRREIPMSETDYREAFGLPPATAVEPVDSKTTIMVRPRRRNTKIL